MSQNGYGAALGPYGALRLYVEPVWVQFRRIRGPRKRMWSLGGAILHHKGPKEAHVAPWGWQFRPKRAHEDPGALWALAQMMTQPH